MVAVSVDASEQMGLGRQPGKRAPRATTRHYRPGDTMPAVLFALLLALAPVASVA